MFNKKIILFLSTIAIAYLLYWGERNAISSFAFLRHLFYLPIILGGLLYGIEGGISIAGAAIFLFAPLIFLEIERFGLSNKGIEYFITLFLFLIIGILGGLFSQKNITQRRLYKSLYDMETLVGRGENINKILEKINEIFFAEFSSFINIKEGKIFIITKAKNQSLEETRNVVLEEGSLLAKIIKNKTPFFSRNLSADSRINLPPPHHLPPLSLCTCPLLYQGHILGMILFLKKERASLDDFFLFKAIAQNLSSSFHNRKLYITTITDSLTGVFNRYYFDQKIEYELSHARGENSLSLILLDIDFFKKINDTFGHQTGDRVLEKISKVIKLYSPTSSAYRIGGEEFAILLPDTNKEKSFQIAETIRKVCEKLPPPFPERRNPITISGGIATFPLDADSAMNLIELADRALYRAKAEGRNKICVYEKI